MLDAPVARMQRSRIRGSLFSGVPAQRACNRATLYMPTFYVSLNNENFPDTTDSR
jgi:hypothetical protein